MKKIVFLLALITVIAACAKESDSSKSGKGSSSGDNSVQVNSNWKYIDGLYFDTNGIVQSPFKCVSSESYESKWQYIYDDQGRVIETHSTVTHKTAAPTDYSSCTYYQYQGKKVTVKSVIEYANGEKKIEEYVREYY